MDGGLTVAHAFNENPAEPKKRVRVTVTRTMWVDLSPDEAECVLPYERDGKMHPQDITELSDHFTRWQRIAAYGNEHYDGYLEVEEADGEAPWYCEAVDGSGRQKYLWSARHFLIEARYQLSSGRYRDGHCPDLDRVNGALAVIEDELRLMALDADGVEWPEVVAWREAKASSRQMAPSTNAVN